MIKLNKLPFQSAILTALMISIYADSNAQSNPTPETKRAIERTDNIIKKNLEIKKEVPADFVRQHGENKNQQAPIIEEIERIYIEGQRDPENLPKKKLTVEQKIDAALHPKASLADPPPVGYVLQCVKNCSGPFCCVLEPGPRSYLHPDSVHK
jgi:hypothetical protein